MTAFLLGTQALVELARRTDNRVTQWAATVPERSVYLSVISIGQLRAEIEALPASHREREVWRASLNDAVHRFQADERLMDVTLTIANRWALIRHLDLKTRDLAGNLLALGADSALVLATALAENLTLVNRRQPCHDLLAPHGLKVLDPYAES